MSINELYTEIAAVEATLPDATGTEAINAAILLLELQKSLIHALEIERLEQSHA